MTRQLKDTNKAGGAPAPPAKHILSPEALDGRVSDKNWSVTETNSITGATDHVARRMRVPIADDSDEANSVRVHELMHARLTPANLLRLGMQKYGRSNDSLQACEDLRLNMAAQKMGIGELWKTPVNEEQVTDIITKLCAAAQAVDAGPSLVKEQASRMYHKAACVTVALQHTQYGELAFKLLHEHAPRDVWYQSYYANNELNYARSISPGVKHPNATIRAAKYLDELLKRHEDGKGDPKAGNLPGGDPTNPKKVPPPPEVAGPDVEALIDRLKIFDPPRTQRMRKQARTYRRTQDCGTLYRPTEAMRLDGTGLPFRRKLKNKHGCAILIDASGSMGFTHAHIAEIIREIPGALVMLHASRGFGPSGAEKGTFAVVGKDGMVCTEDVLQELREEQLGGGNCNDAACALLAGQLAKKHKITGPRFWVTDTGWGNLQGAIVTGNTKEVCRRCAKQANLNIVPNIESIWA